MVKMGFKPVILGTFDRLLFAFERNRTISSNISKVHSFATLG